MVKDVKDGTKNSLGQQIYVNTDLDMSSSKDLTDVSACVCYVRKLA